MSELTFLYPQHTNIIIPLMAVLVVMGLLPDVTLDVYENSSNELSRTWTTSTSARTKRSWPPSIKTNLDIGKY
jgi:NADH:ubiquinone oxidoreductase subunit 4 (subunit M)